MSTSMKVMLILALCFVTTLGFAQASNQAPTYPANATTGTGGQTKWGTVPTVNATTGANTIGTPDGTMGTGYEFTSGQQFNSKWNMVGGNHDLTQGTVGTRTVIWSNSGVASTAAKPSAICSFCHTAHDNESEFTNRNFLWAHEVPTTIATYSSPTLQAGAITFSETSQTAQCMGCHDGSIAVTSGAYGTPAVAAGNELNISGTQVTTGGMLTGGLVVPLSRTHPVGFTYDGTLAAKHQLRVPTTGSVDGFGIVPLFGSGGNQMECATCHDPHLKTGIMRRQFPTGATQDKGTGSFCLYCHL